MAAGLPADQQFVIAPGYLDSDPGHWQTLWQAELGAAARRVVVSSWSEPEFEDWVTALAAVMTPGAVILAHSLGCLASVARLERNPGIARGAFLVALPDPDGPAFPAVIRGFSRPVARVSEPLLMVASSDDLYAGIDYSRATADRLGAALVEIGPAGHISTASGRGPWAEGRRMLAEFITSLDPE